ncbi:MAG: 50S ribosomal protein L18 [Patescibacteria group bacterium]|jgi:large subunit ribosomal protein L18
MNNKAAKKVTNKIKAISNRPRLLVFRSNAEIYAQVVAEDGKILASASSLKLKDVDKIEKAKIVGENVAKDALKNKVSEVVFDRRGLKYHGRVSALADGARKAGLKF